MISEVIIIINSFNQYSKKTKKTLRVWLCLCDAGPIRFQLSIVLAAASAGFQLTPYMDFRNVPEKINISVGFVMSSDGGAPFKPRDGSVPFVVHYRSRYRGVCVGTLVSRTAVLTAASCVTHPAEMDDPRPINVVAGTAYRHSRRGIRVQVKKIIIPSWGNVSNNRAYLMQISPALLLLSRQVPDVMAEIPLRAIPIGIRSERHLNFHEECVAIGWHFFFKGDKIYPVKRFLLQRNLRIQYLTIAKKHVYCDALILTYQKALQGLGFYGIADESSYLCLRDDDMTAQPCHGMYGGPLICRGKAVAMLMAPDAQWTNCTGYSVIMHMFSGPLISDFMRCISSLFQPDYKLDWVLMQKNFVADVREHEYDYVPELYDAILGGESSNED